MKKKIVAFSIADENNLKFFEGLNNSLRKFHSEKDLPLKLIGPNQLKMVKDPMKFYRMTPMVGMQLLEEYETVIKLDADQIITGDISHIWKDKDKFDVGCVNNSNPREMKINPVKVLDIHPLAYFNCGFVVMKNKKFVKHWWKLCNSSHFDTYQYKEQDLLNIMCFYGDYKVNVLDGGTKWHGLISKGYWPQVELKNKKLILPKNNEWPTNEDKEIVCIHMAGGNDPHKNNLRTKFKPEVFRRLEWLKSAKKA